MTADVNSASVDAFVERLLRTESGAQRARLIARHRLTAEELRTAILRIVGEAEGLLGVDPRRMERLCRDALALAEEADDDYGWALARHRCGDSLRAQGHNAEACAYFDEAAAVFTRLGCPLEAARTRVGWVLAAANLGHVREALAAAQRAGRILHAHGDTFRLANLNLNTGNLHLEHGRYQPALRCFTTALGRFESLGERGRLGAARCRASRGNVYTRLGRYREGLVELEQARDAYQRSGEAAGYARVTRSIGHSHLSLGRHTAALRAFEQARSTFRDLEMPVEAVLIARDMVDCYLHLNRPFDALTVLEDAEGDAQRTDHLPDVVGLAIRRAAAHLLLGDRERAVALLDDVEHRHPASLLQHRAWLEAQRAAVLLHDGTPVDALAAARHAHALARSSRMRHLLADVLVIEGAAALGLDQMEEGKRLAGRARRIARTLDAPALLYRVYELLGQVAEREGRRAPARTSYVTAIRHLEREQRGVIFEFRDTFALNRSAAYERLAAIDLVSGNHAAAFATVERAKSRALAEAVAGAVELRPRPGMPPAVRRVARDLATAREDYAAACVERAGSDAQEPDGHVRERLVLLEKRITELTQRLQLTGAADELADLYGATSGGDPLSLPDGTALLEFFFSGNDILRFWGTGGQVRGDVLAGAVPEVERLLRIFRLNLDAAERGGDEGQEQLAVQARVVLNRLHDRLLNGLDEIDDYRSLVIVPHGLLHYLPFHALYDGQRYLVERTVVSYAPSAALDMVCRARAGRRRSRPGPALVLAHSAGGHLGYTAVEAQTVGEVLGATVVTEEAATRAVLQTIGAKADVIHIAAHGEFRADAPLFSSIELADGPLTTADVFSLDLRAGLVALSACTTGRAVIGGGDELVGLARAFLYAGAAALLVSQWRVDDASTAVLMGRVYRERATGASWAEALGRAQIATLSASGMHENSGVHPFFWAGFQLIGDGHSQLRRSNRAAKHRSDDAYDDSESARPAATTHYVLATRRGAAPAKAGELRAAGPPPAQR